MKFYLKYYFLFLLISSYNLDYGQTIYKTKDQIQLVPNKEIAEKIASVILYELYGEENIKSQQPYIIELIGDSIWWIRGNRVPLPKEENNVIIIECGGVVSLKIKKSNCEIVEYSHGR